MKIATIALSFLAFASNASAECYSFYNGAGPSRVGSVALASSAEKMCLGQSSNMSGAVTEYVRLNDYDGDLLRVSAQISRSRSPDGPIVIVLGHGNANGQNVDLTGLTIEIDGEYTNRAPEGDKVQLINIAGEEFAGTMER